jgi:hypothetical protein
MSKSATFALAFLSLTSLTALAQDQAAPPAEGKRSGACAEDVKKFCANVEHGKGQMRACLESHNAELSDGCKTRMAERAKAKEQAPQ